jgi:TetR/AcrR family transcriptional regulator, transcriptional repressor for nem operon
VARYGKEHKEATRRRIIEAAGERLKRDGIDGSGVATLMADAGLTNGAFYGHFASKEDLVTTVVADQLRQQLEGPYSNVVDREGVERFVRSYLSIEHRDDREHGCPSAALLDEIGRCSDPTRHAYTEGVMGLVDAIASILAPDDPASARGQTLSLFALLIGTLQLSRALVDRQLADEVLERGIEKALELRPDAVKRHSREVEPFEVGDGFDVGEASHAEAVDQAEQAREGGHEQGEL